VLNLEFATQNLNSETTEFVRWLIAAASVDVDEMIEEAFNRAAVVSQHEDLAKEELVRDELAKKLKELVVAAMEEVDPKVDNLYGWPVTEADLRRNFVVDSYVNIDCKAAAYELLTLAGRGAPRRLR
jgi:hypothetical protein